MSDNRESRKAWDKMVQEDLSKRLLRALNRVLDAVQCRDDLDDLYKHGMAQAEIEEIKQIYRDLGK